ncbi:MAG: hypothetical protein ACREXW_20270 [Gammaproteobacteria bacterium]
MFEFVDRLGHREVLSFSPGHPVEAVLQYHRIPPASVIVLRDGQPVADEHLVDPSAAYEAALIGGYDINAIRAAYDEIARPSATPGAAYSKRVLSFSTRGTLETEASPLSLEEVTQHVEQTVLDTCLGFSLVKPGDRLLVGLSGGVDSSSLLIALAKLRKRLGSFAQRSPSRISTAANRPPFITRGSWPRSWASNTGWPPPPWSRRCSTFAAGCGISCGA